MAACAQPVRDLESTRRFGVHPALFVLLAIALPVLAGLLWHRASDNPAWPLLRNSLNRCELQEAPLSPLSPDGLYRARVVRATCFGRFDETLVFLNGTTDSWSIRSLDPNRAILELAGDRSLDSISWQDSSLGGTPVLQLWFAPGTSSNQIHRLDHVWSNVIITSLTSHPAPGAERLDY